ncbi:MAG TPA: Holliday junction resolvase RuvX [Longimicrobiales bacterium]
MGRVLGIDFGERRIGLALSDPSATIAQPLPTLTRRIGKRPPIAAIVEIIQQNEVERVVVGLPLDLAGEETEWTLTVRNFADKLQQRAAIPVDFLDERLTSVQAERAVRASGLKKTEREQKARIDAAAAVLLLQTFLDRRIK